MHLRPLRLAIMNIVTKESFAVSLGILNATPRLILSSKIASPRPHTLIDNISYDNHYNANGDANNDSYSCTQIIC